MNFIALVHARENLSFAMREIMLSKAVFIFIFFNLITASAWAGSCSPDGHWQLAFGTKKHDSNDAILIETFTAYDQKRQVTLSIETDEHWSSTPEELAETQWRPDSRAFVVKGQAKRYGGYLLFVYANEKWSEPCELNWNDKKFSVQALWNISQPMFEITRETSDEFLGWLPDGGLRWRHSLTGMSYPTVFQGRIIFDKVGGQPELVYVSAKKALGTTREP